jgi:dihydrodipicolinate synthase/N-acetylneuraminate lyase
MDGQRSAPRDLDLYAIMPTLFTTGGAGVDARSMAQAAEWITNEGISNLLLTGSYGEFQSLTANERVSVLRSVRPVAGVRSVMACAAQPSTEATARLAAQLLDHGADLVMVAPPLLAEVSQGDLFRHFEHLSARFPGRLVIYNNPMFGIDLSPETLEFISALPGVVAIKQGTSSLAALAASIEAVNRSSRGTVRILIASDLTGVLGLLAGGNGLTSTNSWAFPRAVVQLVAAAAVADWERARRVALALEPYFSLVRRLGQPRTVKAAMQLRGLPGTGELRLPYAPLGKPERAELQAVLEQCDGMLEEIGIAPLEPTQGRQCATSALPSSAETLVRPTSPIS